MSNLKNIEQKSNIILYGDLCADPRSIKLKFIYRYYFKFACTCAKMWAHLMRMTRSCISTARV